MFIKICKNVYVHFDRLKQNIKKILFKFYFELVRNYEFQN